MEEPVEVLAKGDFWGGEQVVMTSPDPTSLTSHRPVGTGAASVRPQRDVGPERTLPGGVASSETDPARPVG